MLCFCFLFSYHNSKWEETRNIKCGFGSKPFFSHFIEPAPAIATPASATTATAIATTTTTITTTNTTSKTTTTATSMKTEIVTTTKINVSGKTL